MPTSSIIMQPHWLIMTWLDTMDLCIRTTLWIMDMNILLKSSKTSRCARKLDVRRKKKDAWKRNRKRKKEER